MEEQEKGLSTLEEKREGDETLEGPLGQMEGSFSEELDGACNGRDVMVEVLGSDVYIDGVCTHRSGTELNDDVGCGGSVEGGEGLGKDVKFEGVGSTESEEARSESVAMELDSVAASFKEESLSYDKARKEVETVVSDAEAPVVADDRIVFVNASDHMVTNSRCDNALGCSLTGRVVGGRNVESDCAVKDNGALGDGNDVTIETLDDEKNIANSQSDTIVEKEVCITHIVESKGKLNSEGEELIEIDKVDDNNVEEVVGGKEIAMDNVSSDTGQDLAKEVELNKNVSDAEKIGLHKNIEIEAEDQPHAERIKIKNPTSKIEGEDTQIADQDEPALLNAGNEKINDEADIRQNAELKAGICEQVGSNGGQKNEKFKEAEQRKTEGRVTRSSLVKPWSSEEFNQARYVLPTEKEGEFSLSDMVWGKVRSHPWWPGQICDPSDASEKAMKHYKKDCYLVAYFGDRTFAWNEESQLKPFRTYFSSIVKQSTSESFQNAVECALDEVTRRVEYGLACSCIPKDTYDSIKFQIVENTGIRPELNLRHVTDKSLDADSFFPDNLVEYLKMLSVLPTSGFDRTELVIANAQLLAYCRFKGYSSLPELQYFESWDEDKDTFIHDDEKNLSEGIVHGSPIIKNDSQEGLENSKHQNSSRRKRKHNLKDMMHSTKKQRRLSELMGGTPNSPDGDYWAEEKAIDILGSPGHAKKRKTVDNYAEESGMQDRRKTISVAKVSTTTKQPSFKIGDCIRRVASKLTGSPSMKSSGDRSLKTDGSGDGFSVNGFDIYVQNLEEAQRSSVVVSTEYSSLEDLLSSLQGVAQEPLGDYSFLNAIVSFFSDFRNSVAVTDDSVKEIFRTEKVGNKRKKLSAAGTPETFEFEDMNDTYWTDRVIDNGNEEQPAQLSQPSQPSQPVRRYRKKDNQLVLAEPGKVVQVTRRPYNRKQYSHSNHDEVPEKPPGYIDENAPAELVMNFAELDSVPSEANLNKTFRRFGPLKESETEVDTVSSRARVVFKKCVDAEVACSSAQKFNIFGQILVNYQLNYTPSALFKAPPVSETQDQEMHFDLSNFEVNMV